MGAAIGDSSPASPGAADADENANVASLRRTGAPAVRGVRAALLEPDETPIRLFWAPARSRPGRRRSLVNQADLHRRRRGGLAGLALWLALGALAAPPAAAARTLNDYRYFRALAVDLLGRIPSRDEVAAFEKDGFDVGAWIDQQLQGPQYARRMTRVYQDLMRLEIGGSFQFVQAPTVLRRQTVLGPDGKPLYVYFRDGQRRARPETDGDFCLTQAETGLQFPHIQPPLGTPTPVAARVLDQFTVLVKPWWLYRDYAAQAPVDRYDPLRWGPLGFQPAPALLLEPDGTTPTTAVRVCAEEAQAADSAPIYASGRTRNPPMLPYGRLDFPPLDNAYATANAGKPISCDTATGFSLSNGCGCGPGLLRCLPSPSYGFETAALVFPSRLPLGAEAPLDAATQAQGAWARLWWGQEAAHFFDYLFSADRDFREVLTGRYSFVNGPLVQFYRHVAPEQCCGQGLAFGYVAPTPLFDPATLPADLPVQDASTWKMVSDRGPNASGLLTMPVFLTKYGTRRARAHVLWNAFACRDFVAGNVQLKPSTEPDLTRRDGCNICHATLEPLAAYFTRIQESTWMYLPPASFPVGSSKCGVAEVSKMSTACKTFYDPAFTTAQSATLRGAYASAQNADAGPAALAAYLTSTSQFESCVAQNVAASFLGRALSPDDQVLQQKLAQSFAQGGFRMRALVKALLTSSAYRAANNLTSSALRQGGAL